MVIEEISKRVNLVHDVTARYMPRVVHCAHCGKLERVEPANYLRAGRPRCCSQPMELGHPKHEGSAPNF